MWPCQQPKIKYSTVYASDPIGVGHGSGRLGSNQAWRASSPVPGEWMQFDLSEQQVISGVVNQGRRSAWQWVTSFYSGCGPEVRVQTGGDRLPGT